MGRFSKFSGTQKPIANLVAQTTVFPSAEIESAGVIAYHLTFTGANDLDDIVRVRVRGSGDTLIDVPILHLRAYQQAWNRANLANVNTGNVLTIPLNLLDAPTPDQRDKCQFPPGAQAQVEIEWAATVVTGVAILGWTQTDIPPELFMRYYSATLNIAQSQRNAKYQFADSGVVRGFTLPTVGIDQAELVISGRTAWRLPGTQFSALAFGNMLTNSDSMEAANAVTTAICKRVDLGLPAASGASLLTLDSGAAWVGAANEGSIYSVQTLGRGA